MLYYWKIGNNINIFTTVTMLWQKEKHTNTNSKHHVLNVSLRKSKNSIFWTNFQQSQQEGIHQRRGRHTDSLPQSIQMECSHSLHLRRSVISSVWNILPRKCVVFCKLTKEKCREFCIRSLVSCKHLLYLIWLLCLYCIITPMMFCFGCIAVAVKLLLLCVQ